MWRKVSEHLMDTQQNRDKDPSKEKKKKKSRFNMLFTLLFVIVVFALLLQMIGGDSFGGTKEISAMTFYKLLYTCRITRLEVTGPDKIEGEYIKTESDLSGDGGRFGDSSEEGGTGRFVAQLNDGDLHARSPRFSDFLGRTVEDGSPSILLNDLANDQIHINSYYRVIADDFGSVETAAKHADAARLKSEQGAGAPSTLLFIDMIDSQGISRFMRYDFSSGATYSGDDAGLINVLAAIQDKFPDAASRSEQYSVRNEGSLEYNQPNSFLTSLVATLIPWILIIGIFWFFILRQMRASGGGGGVFSFGKSRATLVNKEKTTETFEDVAGIVEAKEEVVEIIEFLRNPGRFSRLGGRIPSGVLLVGPPGTGKTLLAKAIAGEADVPFFSISGSDFVEMFVGVGASRVRDLFRQARESSPCLIFLDEIDAVGRKRGSGLGGGHDEREQTLNAILVEMDGFEKDEGIILLAATNRPDVLDPALLRPGRFDREIIIDLPDLRGREEILKVHCRKIKVGENVDLSIVARGTPTFSGAELAALANEAALIATMKNKDAVHIEDLEEARDKIRWGRQKRSRTMDEEDRLLTAYHESGHALVAHLLPEVEPLHKVTIIPRGMALGATMQLPEKDRYHNRKKELLGNIVVLYAGRIAEQMFCGDISSGAQNDIQRATELARIMVCRLGMSDNLGPVSYDEQQDHVFLGEELVRSRSHAPETMKAIDSEVKLILGDCYKKSEVIIEENRDMVEKITLALMEYETLTGDEVNALMQGEGIESIEETRKAQQEAKSVRPPIPASEAKDLGQENEETDPDDLPAEGEFAY